LFLTGLQGCPVGL